MNRMWKRTHKSVITHLLESNFLTFFSCCSLCLQTLGVLVAYATSDFSINWMNKINAVNTSVQCFFFFIFLNTVECGTFVRNWNMSKLWVTISYALNARPIITMCPRVLYANEHRTTKTERKKKREWKKRKKKIRMHWALRPQFFSVFFENKSRGINIKIEISRRRRKKKCTEKCWAESERHTTRFV